MRVFPMEMLSKQGVTFPMKLGHITTPVERLSEVVRGLYAGGEI
jgi:hypothetical protein|uniref:Cpsf4l protein n=1 Tax=Mus musculus TaxID=10090 RepID=Q99KK5_MOUSE|nr:Cpsf4l protein [Mus musculus]